MRRAEQVISVDERAEEIGLNEDLEQEALFELEGPDEDRCVWLVAEHGVVVNLGPRDKVAEKMAEWLSQIDFGE
jgi:hypothetical protein